MLIEQRVKIQETMPALRLRAGRVVVQMGPVRLSLPVAFVRALVLELRALLDMEN